MGRKEKEMKGVLRVDKGEEYVVIAGGEGDASCDSQCGREVLTQRLCGTRGKL